MNGGADIRDPLTRQYLLAAELHIPPPYDDLPAVELDELLVLHARVLDLQAKKAEAARG